MGLSAVTYVLAKKYTDETAAQFGGLKGAPCQVKSVVKENGQNIITLQWVNDEGETRETKVYINDGTPIYTWEPGYSYEYGDLAIYQASFYRCTTPNSDLVFDDTKWAEIGSPDGNYDIVATAADLPIRFTHADRKMYYVIDQGIFHLWNGTEWVPQNVPRIEEEDIDSLFY